MPKRLYGTVSDYMALFESEEKTVQEAEKKVIQLPAVCFTAKSFEGQDGLIPFTAYAYHDQLNANGSYIKPEDFTDCTSSIPYRPILASIVVDEDGNKDFGGHDRAYVENEDGEWEIKYIERPVGVISDYEFEYDDKQEVNRAVVHGFIYDGYCQDAVDILERRGEVDCSIELEVSKMHYDKENQYLCLDSYICAGLTMLGADKLPGMTGSRLSVYEAQPKVDSYFESLTPEELNKIRDFSSVIFGKNLDEDESEKKGEEVMDEDKKMTEAEVENPEEVKVEEFEEKVEEITDEEVKPEYTLAELAGMVDYALKKPEDLYEKRRKICAAVFAKFDKAQWVSKVYEDTVIFEDWAENNFRVSYAMENDEVVLGESEDAVSCYWLTDKEAQEYEDAKTAMENKLSDALDRLGAYEKAEQDAEKEAVFTDDAYAKFLEAEEFKAVYEKKDELSVDDLKIQCELAFAKCQRKVQKTEKHNNVDDDTAPVKGAKVFAKARDDKPTHSRYGNIFNK